MCSQNYYYQAIKAILYYAWMNEKGQYGRLNGLLCQKTGTTTVKEFFYTS
jgi:hypothetical protein